MEGMGRRLRRVDGGFFGEGLHGLVARSVQETARVFGRVESLEQGSGGNNAAAAAAVAKGVTADTSATAGSSACDTARPKVRGGVIFLFQSASGISGLIHVTCVHLWAPLHGVFCCTSFEGLLSILHIPSAMKP